MSSPAPSSSPAAVAAAPAAAGADAAAAGPGKKPRGGKFAQKNAKRKAKRAAEEAGIVPGGPEENDPNSPWYKKPRNQGRAPRGSAERSAEDRVHDPERRNNNGLYSLNADSGGFMVSAPDCPKFNDYYRAQGIVSEEEWPAFLEALRTKLPTTFRVSTISGMHASLLHELRTTLRPSPEENKLGMATSYTYTDPQTRVSHVIDPPAPLPWYPHSLGWYLRAGKSELKTRGNAFAKFRAFLMAQYDQGNLNRQEAVSMIPPLLLDVKPQHVVLDMCAAPGSKTAQLLEGLHGGLDYEDAFKTPVEGMVIANDSDTRRAYLLVHQLKRYGSSAFLVTTHDGQMFPNLYKNAPAQKAGGEAAAAAAASAPPASSLSEQTAAAFSGSEQLVPFDRILCDVPCSGDGTMRKNINLWSMWDTKFANGLHALQIQIACRALEMLKVGGLMVYSTCSFNPVENESVVMELCRRCGKDNLEIVDVSDKLPGLIRRPGLTDWKVLDAHANRWAQADEPEIINATHKQLRPSMFPPTAEEIATFKPERCVRIVPHSQDTGGFFIALLRKTGETHGVKNPAAYAKLMQAQAAAQAAAAAAGGAAPSSSPDPVVPDAEDDAAARAAQSVLAELPDTDGADAAGAKDALAALPAGLDDLAGTKGHKQAVKGKDGGGRIKGTTEDPFEPMDPETVRKIIDFYGLSHGVDHTNFFTRSDGQRKCYFVAPAIAALLHCPRNAQRLKIVHTGSRCYERGGKPEDDIYPCQYRVVQEGVESVLPFMTRQLMHASFADALQVLYRFAWPYKEMDRTGAQQDMWKELLKHKNGCMVWLIPGSEIAKHTTQPPAEEGAGGRAAASCRSIPICIWKTPHSVSLMISSVEQAALLKLLDPEEKHMPADVRAKKQKKAEEEAAKAAERQAKQQAYQQKAKQKDTAYVSFGKPVRVKWCGKSAPRVW